jgi:hypothetical protein
MCPKTIEPRIKVKMMPTTVRLPEDIWAVLPDVVLYDHKVSVGELVRDIVVEKIVSYLNTPRFIKWRKQKEERGK